MDWQSLHGKAVTGVAAAALEPGVPAIVVAGQVFLGRRETMSLGLSGCYAVADTPEQVEAAMADPVGTLTERVRPGRAHLVAHRMRRGATPYRGWTRGRDRDVGWPNSGNMSGPVGVGHHGAVHGATPTTPLEESAR